MPFRLGGMELIIVLVIVLIIFGVGRLPEIGGALGKSIREFRDASKDGEGKATGPEGGEPPPADATARAEAALEDKPQA